MDLDAIQSAIRAQRLDGWFFYDHHHRDPIAYRILGLPVETLATRRWYYLIPARGEPLKLVHRIEAGALDSLPGERRLYARWNELDDGLGHLLGALVPAPRIAMQYSLECALPAISYADAGTVEHLRRLGAVIVGSGDLIGEIDAVWSPGMLASHRAAGRVIDATIAAAFAAVRQYLDAGRCLTEFGLQAWLVEQLRAGGVTSEEAPIVAVNAHAGDPHYEPRATGAAPIAAGDLLLLDVWGKTVGADTAYYDVTWIGYCLRAGETAPPEEFERTFALVRDARDAAVSLVLESVAAGRPLRGCQVDRAARGVIEAAGLGAFFTHRTGHSLGVELHASGANMDDFETHDERLIRPRSGFSIEPGIYLPGGQAFGVRTEVNVYVGEGGAEVTGPAQREIVRI